MLEAQRDKSSVSALSSLTVTAGPHLEAVPEVTAVEKPLQPWLFPNSEGFSLHFQKKKKISWPEIWSLKLAFDHQSTPKEEPW